MRESSRSGVVAAVTFLIGVVIGALTEIFTSRLEGIYGVSAVVVFGLGLGLVEGPALISAIVLARKVTRIWVRTALQATGPFVAFFAYLLAYGFLRHPPFAFPF